MPRRAPSRVNASPGTNTRSNSSGSITAVARGSRIPHRFSARSSHEVSSTASMMPNVAVSFGTATVFPWASAARSTESILISCGIAKYPKTTFASRNIAESVMRSQMARLTEAGSKCCRFSKRGRRNAFFRACAAVISGFLLCFNFFSDRFFFFFRLEFMNRRFGYFDFHFRGDL